MSYFCLSVCMCPLPVASAKHLMNHQMDFYEGHYSPPAFANTKMTNTSIFTGITLKLDVEVVVNHP